MFSCLLLLTYIYVMFLRSERICPLILWIWLSVIFVVLALAEYFVILLTIKFKGRKVNDKLYE